LLHVDKGTGVNEGVVRVGLGLSKPYAFVSVERPGELVAVNDTEDTSIKLDVDSNTEIFPSVGLNAAGFRNEMAFQEDALWNARILDTRLNDVQSSIF
jgi:hypothetical protein